MNIYTLELEDNKYFIDCSPDNKFVLDYFKSLDYEWLKLYPVVNIHSVYKITDISKDEVEQAINTYCHIDRITILMMNKYSIENVRSRTYSSVEISDHDEFLCKKFMMNCVNICYKCSSTQHTSAICDYKPKKEPEKTFLINNDTNWMDEIEMSRTPFDMFSSNHFYGADDSMLRSSYL